MQSNVILDYLARTTGQFACRTEQEQWTAREWLSWEADNITNVAKVRHYSRFRQVDPAVMDYFRPLAEAAIDATETCLYTVTPDDHFRLGFLPARNDVIVASPCSGHGFKFSCLICSILADLAIQGQTATDIAPWRLS